MRRWLIHGIRVLACSAALIVAGCGGSDGPPPPRVGAATIGAAGGTVDGPDGVQLIVPPGALDADVTIRIARTGAGAPALPAEWSTELPVYEFTPHNLRFSKPVQVRVPVTGPVTPEAVALVAQTGGAWSATPASYDNGVATIERSSLSWYTVGGGYVYACVRRTGDPVDPYFCSFASVTLDPIGSTPASALRVSERRIVEAGVLHLPLRFAAPRDCGSGQLRVWRNARRTGGSWTSDLVLTQSVALSPASSTTVTGSHRFEPALTGADNGVLSYFFQFDCIRAFGSRSISAAAVLLPHDVDIVTPPAAPTIDRQPASATASEGTAVEFSVLVSAASTLAYEWQRSNDGGATWAPIGAGTAIAGGSRIGLTATMSDNGAMFRARVCNVGPTTSTCVTSASATLTVNAVLVGPVFTLEPVNQSVVSGQTASFSVAATGTPLPMLRWQTALAGSSAFADVTGVAACTTVPPTPGTASTTATCTLGPLTVADSGLQVRAVANSLASGPAGVASRAAVITVGPVPVAPSITVPPVAQSATVGGSATFTVGATGTSPLAYRWSLGGSALPASDGPFTVGSCSGRVSYGSGGATVTLSELTIGCNGVIVAVTVSNGIDPAATSPGVTLTVSAPSPGLALLAGAIGGPGLVDGDVADARLSMDGQRNGIAVDGAGSVVFTDFQNRIRKLTPAGVVSTIAGATTPLRDPSGLAIDSAGNVFVAERGRHQILRITPAGTLSVWAGGVQGHADGVGTAASFQQPTHLAIDTADNLYVVETAFGSRRIRRITPAQGVSTVADLGSTVVGAITVGSDGQLYGAGFGTILRITTAGAVSVLAGATGEDGNVDGPGAAARFGYGGVSGLVTGPGGDLFATDGNNRTIRRITLFGDVSTVSGAPGSPVVQADGAGSMARYEAPGAIARTAAGDLLIGDVSTIRRLTPAFAASTLLGRWLPRETVDATGTAARFRNPGPVVLDAAGNAFVADQDRIRKVTPSGVVTTLAVLRVSELALDGSAGLVAASSNAVWRVTFAGVATLQAGSTTESDYVDGTGADARFGAIRGLAVDAGGNVYVSERINANATIRRITPAGVVTTWAGAIGATGSADGPRADARFAAPAGLAFDAAGNLFVADEWNHTIRRITPAGVVSTVAGLVNAPGRADGSGSAARFTAPDRLAVDAAGQLWIGDGGALRRMSPSGDVTTRLGAVDFMGVKLGSSAPQLNRIAGLAWRVDGRVVVTSEAAVLEATLP